MDPDFLRVTGMDREFAVIFNEMGWDTFWQISEAGSKLVTAEFLCTLQLFSNVVTFCLFNKEFKLTWKELSEHFGFCSKCIIDVDSTILEFDKTKFWREISGEDKCDHSRTNSIQLPTLRFIHKWMGFTLFPRDDIRIVKEDLKLMLAMIKREKVAPIQFMMVHWSKVFNRIGAIEYTSLVTRLAENLGLMDTALVENIIGGCTYINDHMR